MFGKKNCLILLSAACFWNCQKENESQLHTQPSEYVFQVMDTEYMYIGKATPPSAQETCELVGRRLPTRAELATVLPLLEELPIGQVFGAEPYFSTHLFDKSSQIVENGSTVLRLDKSSKELSEHVNRIDLSYHLMCVKKVENSQPIADLGQRTLLDPLGRKTYLFLGSNFHESAKDSCAFMGARVPTLAELESIHLRLETSVFVAKAKRDNIYFSSFLYADAQNEVVDEMVMNKPWKDDNSGLQSAGPVRSDLSYLLLCVREMNPSESEEAVEQFVYADDVTQKKFAYVGKVHRGRARQICEMQSASLPTQAQLQYILPRMEMTDIGNQFRKASYHGLFLMENFDVNSDSTTVLSRRWSDSSNKVETVNHLITYDLICVR